MTEDRENNGQTGREAGPDLDLEDLVLDEAFLTSWEASLRGEARDPGPAPKQEAGPEPPGEGELNLDDLILDVSVFEGTGGRGEEAPGAKGDEGDFPGMEDVILDEAVLDEPVVDEEMEDETRGETPEEAPAGPAPGRDARPPEDRREAAEAGRGFLRSRWAYAAAALLALIALAAVAAVKLPLLNPPEPVERTPVFVESGERFSVEGLFLPLKEGERGLYVSMSLKVAGRETSPGEEGYLVREVAYEAAGSFDPEELATYRGMKALKAEIAARLKERLPGMKIEGVHFTEYTIL